MAFAGTGVRKSKRGTPLLGRRCVFINDGQYSYNVRDEFIFGQNQTYAYDDIGVHAPTSVSEVGNRTTAEGKTYTANNLNQYTAIDDFVPQYDADGNQTLIKTETGIWSVVYNAENRLVRWTRGDTIVTMAFDRLGRRVDYQETQDDQVAAFAFPYLLSQSEKLIAAQNKSASTPPCCCKVYKEETICDEEANRDIEALMERQDRIQVGPRIEKNPCRRIISSYPSK